MDNTFISVLTGNDHHGVDVTKVAIALRAAVIVSSFEHQEGSFVYDGNRCDPANLGWRFVQYYGAPPISELFEGKWDQELEATYHDAASAEHWYRHEKDWG